MTKCLLLCCKKFKLKWPGWDVPWHCEVSFNTFAACIFSLWHPQRSGCGSGSSPSAFCQLLSQHTEVHSTFPEWVRLLLHRLRAIQGRPPVPFTIRLCRTVIKQVGCHLTRCRWMAIFRRDRGRVDLYMVLCVSQLSTVWKHFLFFCWCASAYLLNQDNLKCAFLPPPLPLCDLNFPSLLPSTHLYFSLRLLLPDHVNVSLPGNRIVLDLLFDFSLTIVRDLLQPSMLLSSPLPVLLLWLSSCLCCCPSPPIHNLPRHSLCYVCISLKLCCLSRQRYQHDSDRNLAQELFPLLDS